jgi:serine/threonine-protein kinase
MILPNMQAFMEGKYEPQSNDERLGLLGICQFTNRTRAMSRLYADVFAATPPLADNLGTGHRYTAARAAALAGCGRGDDANDLTEAERKHWRDQARVWLRADLAAWTKALNADPTRAREAVQKALTGWREDPDLAGLREPGELNKLPAEERKDCAALWAEVAAVLDRTRK